MAADTEAATKRPMPKGGRKGGASFPRVALDDALKYGRKLVSKTHTGAQPQDIIFSGVVGAKSGTGEVRISALRQYGLLTGDKQSGFQASDLAKQIVAAPEEDLQRLYRQCALSPKIFKAIFDAFHGDTISRGKLRQRAADLKVHPDELDACIDAYVASLGTAALIRVEGDQIVHVAAAEVVSSSSELPTDADEEPEQVPPFEPTNAAVPTAEMNPAPASQDENSARPVRANVNVNITLDSTMDVEKLAKQLELLKKYGAI